MRIAHRRGHNFQATGAAGIINEVAEAEAVNIALEKYLKQLGHETYNVSPGNMDSDSDLVYGVAKANALGVDLFISIHFNKAYNSYSGPLGTEAWIYSKSDNIILDDQVGQRVTNALAKLGFKNRGVKESTQLFELKGAKMASVIAEICFVESETDVSLYKQLGPDAIGKALAEAITGETIPAAAPATKKEEEKKVEYIIQYSNSIDKNIAEIMADRLNCPTIDSTRPYAHYGKYETVIAVGEAKNKSGYTNVLIQGSNRKETLEKALEYLDSLGK